MTEVPSEGRVVSYSVVHVAPARFAEAAPYVVALVELDGGLTVQGVVAGDPSRVEVGLRVKVAPEPQPEAGWPRWSRLVFEPAEGDAISATESSARSRNAGDIFQ